jgi:hypothetical protein
VVPDPGIGHYEDVVPDPGIGHYKVLQFGFWS